MSKQKSKEVATKDVPTVEGELEDDGARCRVSFPLYCIARLPEENVFVVGM